MSGESARGPSHTRKHDRRELQGRRWSSIINLRPSDIALAILKLAFLDARRFSLSLWRCSDAFFARFA